MPSAASKLRNAALCFVATVLAATPAHAEPMQDMPGMEHEHGEQPMQMTGVLGIPMSRVGSGTAWLPDDTPMRAFHFMVGDWVFMVHGNVIAGPDVQGSDTGATKLVSQNWIMGMADHALGPGRLTGRAMLSLEPFTVEKRG